MIHDNDAQLAAWLANGPANGPEGALDRALKAARTTRQRPAWVVTIRGGTIAAERHASVQLVWVTVAVVALIGLLAGAIVVGGWLRPQPPSVVLPSPPLPSVVPEGTGLVAYTGITQLEQGEGVCPHFNSTLCFPARVWIANADGTGAHRLLPEPSGDAPIRQIALAWSPDGRWLLYRDDQRLLMTDAAGSEPQLVMEAGCADVCFDFDGVTVSPDGTRIAFLRTAGTGSVIATLDLATGRITELESTRTTDDPSNDAPRWSPDGTRLTFARQATGPSGGRLTNVFVVNADGSDLRALTLDELFAIDPDWAPDGSSIVFLASAPVNGEQEPFVSDIYTIRLDGTGIRQLTRDGVSARPNWTADGRIVFVRMPTDAEGAVTAFELWVMNADGSGQTQLDAGDLAELTDANCVICPYPPMDVDADIQFLFDAFWQPTP